MIATCLALAVAVLAAVPIERLAARREAPGFALSGLPARIAACSVLFAFWLGWFRRPLLAAFATLVTIGILTAISRRKRALVGEPLVFSDFGLIRTIVRHPDLYYLGFFRDLRFIAAVMGLAAGIAIWDGLEPALLSPIGGVCVVAATLLVVGTVWLLAARNPVARIVARIRPRPTLEADLGRWGLLATLCGYGLRWRGELGEPWPSLPGPAATPLDPAPDVVVVVQLESFTDPARIGLASLPLPGLARARALASWHGPLGVPTHGAFTMRSEHEVLTGQDGAWLFRGFDPYLAKAGPAPPSLASRLKPQGYRTVFMHPFRATFFNRQSVMPRLGFDSTLWEEDFRDAPRHGPYVSDRAVADQILAGLREAEAGQTFVMAVTMENHGPWAAGRLPGERDPTRQYLAHLAGSDEAILALIDGLEALGRPALLCLYGDHPPILPGWAPSGVPETEYAVIRFGPGVSCRPVPPVRLATHRLGQLMRDLTAGSPQG